MASKEATAIRCDRAIQNIEQLFEGLGVDVERLPRLHRDREILRAIQLEAIRDALAQVTASENAILTEARELIQSRYTKQELEAVLHGTHNGTD